MRNFLFLLSFIVIFSLVTTIALAQDRKATYEEENIAQEKWVTFRYDTLNVQADKPDADLPYLLQRCLDFREQYSHSRWVACSASRTAAFIYETLGQFQEALECYQWVTEFYADLKDQLLTISTKEGRDEHIDQLEALEQGTDEYEEEKHLGTAATMYERALLGETSMLIRLKRYEEAKHIYMMIKEFTGKSGPYGWPGAVLVNDEEKAILTDCIRQREGNMFRGATFVNARVDNIADNFYEHRSKYLYDNMLCLIEHKLAEEEK